MRTLPLRARARARAGFTLAELLISMVIVAVIGAALTRLVVAQSRFYNSQTLQRSARDVSRSALNILRADLRMVEETNSLTEATPTALTALVPYAVGIACTATLVHTMPADSAVIAEAVTQTAKIGVRNMTDNQYVTNTSASVALVVVDTATGRANCATAGITRVWGGRFFTTPSLGANFVYAGQPILLYRTIRYTIASSGLVPGRMGLYRAVGGGTPEEIVAPLTSAASFQYYTYNSAAPGVAPASKATIYGIRFNLIGASERSDPTIGTVQEAQLVTSVFFKNRKV